MTNNTSIILMQPQMGENIGAAARAMANFGLSDLRLIDPRDGWPNERAIAMASGALPDFVHVSVFETLDEAIADIQFVLATTARRRDMTKPVYTSSDAAESLIQKISEDLRVAILFGRERNGLENDEVAKAQGIIHIPTSPDFASLNLGQSVLLMGYELLQKKSDVPEETLATERSPIAQQKDVQDFLSRLEQELEKGGFFRSEGLRPHMERNIKNIFTRAELTEQEVNTLQGILSALTSQR